MQANLAATGDFIFGEEGNLSLLRSDPGNWTGGRVGAGALIGSRWGISAPVLMAWLSHQVVTAATMAALPKDTAVAILGTEYYQAMRCPDLPAGLDLSVCDEGWNAGKSTAGRQLQAVLGFSGADLDGWIGPATAEAACKPAADPAALLAGISATTAMAVQAALGVPADGAVGPQTLAALAAHAESSTIARLAALAERQAAYYRALPGFAVDGRGWLNRVEARLKAALGLAIAQP